MNERSNKWMKPICFDCYAFYIRIIINRNIHCGPVLQHMARWLMLRCDTLQTMCLFLDILVPLSVFFYSRSRIIYLMKSNVCVSFFFLLNNLITRQGMWFRFYLKRQMSLARAQIDWKWNIFWELSLNSHKFGICLLRMADGTMLMADYSNRIRNYQQNHRECSYTPKKMSCMMNSFVLFCFVFWVFVNFSLENKNRRCCYCHWYLVGFSFGSITVWPKQRQKPINYRSTCCHTHAHTHPVVGRPQLTDGTLLFVRSNDIIDNCVNAYFVGHFAQCSS